MAEVSLKLTETQIQNAISIALTEALSQKDKDILLRDVVRAHMNYKENSYDRETLLSKQVGETVRRIASEKMALILESWKPEVEAVVEKTLGKNIKVDILSQIEYALGRATIANMKISIDLKDNDE